MLPRPVLGREAPAHAGGASCHGAESWTAGKDGRERDAWDDDRGLVGLARVVHDGHVRAATCTPMSRTLVLSISGGCGGGRTMHRSSRIVQHRRKYLCKSSPRGVPILAAARRSLGQTKSVSSLTETRRTETSRASVHCPLSGVYGIALIRLQVLVEAAASFMPKSAFVSMGSKLGELALDLPKALIAARAAQMGGLVAMRGATDPKAPLARVGRETRWRCPTCGGSSEVRSRL